jgi:hypothetical protein
LILALLSLAGPVGVMAEPRDHEAGHAQDLVLRRLVLLPGQVEAAVTAEIGLDQGRVAKPWSVAPDFVVGVLPKLDIGIVSSFYRLSRIEAGGGICTQGKVGGCDGAYRNVGVDIRYLALDASSDNRTLQIAPRARLLFKEFDPLKPALLLGAFAKWQFHRFAVTADPYLQDGLVNRNKGNRMSLNVPLTLTVQPTCRWAMSLRTGFDFEIAVIKDGWHVPLAALVKVAVTPGIDLDVQAGFPSLIGPQNTTKRRSAGFTLTLRTP